MHSSLTRPIVLLLVAVGLVLLTAGSAIAQEPTDDGSPFDGVILGDPAQFPDELDMDGMVAPAEADLVLAQPPYRMNYQGYLTDGSGSPLSGSYNMEASLWDAATVGTREWGPEAHAAVAVNKGLFHLVLGESVTLAPNVFDEALYLEIKVGTTTLPRQPLRATAYAYGLVPGAEVQGDPAGTTTALAVANTGTGAADDGLSAAGHRYGIYVSESGTGDVALYSQDFIDALGYRSRRDSYVFVPGLAGLGYIDETTDVRDLDIYPQGSGSVRLRCNVDCVPATAHAFYIPIDTPTVLFGQNVRVEAVTVFYDLTSANSFVTETTFRRVAQAGLGADANNYVAMISDTTDRKSTDPTSYSLTPAAGTGTLTSDSGGLFLRLILSYSNANDSIFIGGVRVRFGHTP